MGLSSPEVRRFNRHSTFLYPGRVSIGFCVDDLGHHRGNQSRHTVPKRCPVCLMQTMNMEKNDMESKRNATHVAEKSKSAEESTLRNGPHEPQTRIGNSGNGLRDESICPHCQGRARKLDSFADSQTIRCGQCLQCALVKSSPLVRTVIPLRSFHLMRGVGSMLRPLHDMVMAEELVECLKNDRWPSKATTLDFGIATPSHLGALQSAHWGGCNVYDFDRVLGDGKAITQLVHAVQEQRYPNVRFFTVYDGWALTAGQWEWPEEDV